MRLQQFWQNQGHHTFLATGSKEAKGTAVYHLPDTQKSDFLVEFIGDKQIEAVLWQYSPYAWHPRGTPWWMVMAMWRVRKAGIPQAIFFHEVQIRYSEPGLFNKFRALQQQIIANLCAKLAGGRIATSIPLYQSYFLGVRPALIPISPNLLPQSAMATCPLRVVAFANRIFPWLLAALAQVQKELPKVEVVWLGKKSTPLSSDDILNTYGLTSRFTGEISNEALAAEMQAAHIVLLPLSLGPARQGGISLKSGTLSAALGMRKAVIASSGDMTETNQLVHGKVLHLLSVNNTDAWKQAIFQVLQQPGYADTLATGGHGFYQSFLSWDKTGPAILDLF